MTELDELRDAMESPPDYVPVALDLGHIMAAGGRVRRRRRATTIAASSVAVVALLIVGGQLTNLRAAPAATGAAYPEPSGIEPSAMISSAPGILGRVVETGRWVDGRQWILYVETVDPNKLNENMTLVLGRTKTGYINDFTADIIGSDTGDTRMHQGFHAVEPATVKGGRDTPTFGYYAGNATRISARDTATGRTVDAHLTAWSGFGAKEKAQIFWFDFAQGQTPANLTALTAYDKNGKKLP